MFNFSTAHNGRSQRSQSEIPLFSFTRQTPITRVNQGTTSICFERQIVGTAWGKKNKNQEHFGKTSEWKTYTKRWIPLWSVFPKFAWKLVLSKIHSIVSGFLVLPRFSLYSEKAFQNIFMLIRLVFSKYTDQQGRNITASSYGTGKEFHKIQPD